MSNAALEALREQHRELITQLTRTETAVTRVREDIARLVAGLPNEGGLTQEELDTFKGEVVATVAKATAVADAAEQADTEGGENTTGEESPVIE